jgi:hypothetical protein
METVDRRSAASIAIRIDNSVEPKRVFQKAFHVGDLDGLVSLLSLMQCLFRLQVTWLPVRCYPGSGGQLSGDEGKARIHE